ncbi:MAG: metal-dependent transcriptional regulator [Thermoanaerobaculia bacterium]
MPTSTVEDYLKSILKHMPPEPGGLVSMGQIGSDLRVAPGTVTAMVKTLAESGLVEYEPYSGVRLTKAGRQLALHVLRRHRLIELFLVQVVGLDWSEVHDEAERMEHAVSDRLIERLDALLGHPTVDPHGDPIPTLQGRLTPQDHLRGLLECEPGEEIVIQRVVDQSEEFLRLLDREGLKPGSRWRVLEEDLAADTMELGQGDKRLRLGRRAASKLLVEPAG